MTLQEEEYKPEFTQIAVTAGLLVGASYLLHQWITKAKNTVFSYGKTVVTFNPDKKEEVDEAEEYLIFVVSLLRKKYREVNVKRERGRITITWL